MPKKKDAWRRRPRKPESQKKSAVLSIKLTEAELAAAKSAAVAAAEAIETNT